jgi:NAD(P)H-dependent FMN reductase
MSDLHVFREYRKEREGSKERKTVLCFLCFLWPFAILPKKNSIPHDLLYPEWKRKPVSLAAVSNGPFAGSQVLTSLSFSFLKIGATVVPNMYRAGNVQDVYDENGNAKDAGVSKFAKSFVDELLWYVEATSKMKES